jgi:hypothetical protein
MMMSTYVWWTGRGGGDYVKKYIATEALAMMCGTY